MPFKIRRVQDKKKRETNEIKNAELQEIRRENQKLKREVARLRREVQKNPPSTTIEAEVEIEETPLKKINDNNHCPECGSDQISQIKFNIKVLTICKKCKWRSNQA